tara:strand:- start:19987 stop:20115 length:129 start_codon:yes stop_codon:yes gene_type:complete
MLQNDKPGLVPGLLLLEIAVNQLDFDPFNRWSPAANRPKADV